MSEKKMMESMRQQRSRFVELMRKLPLVGVDIDLERPDSLTRDFTL